MNEIHKAINWMIEATAESKEAKDNIVALAIHYGCPEKVLNNDFRGARLYLEGFQKGARNGKNQGTL